ncbi:MAG: DUF420 domain-containing protein [Candidatus Marinimicrobia bacterium]|jgi:putative membrane protein|nr:DUF420 domain-containing protein [Candidatus Neomarinimicrobiota bacterium]MDP6593606.1 DUF420 domain-containing protein [Candidatus Neomarinimicrobiota bacterium]MDP6836243.1 DUF420 domain-containing protein [Candidatus Neomarinimicrobiota bacterium]MDP6966170.1 DUF420 domain-containing protein [Candidatus Neomarinimicrobiota bacterium]|tara:strand:+ start:2395 stop:2928 length:534 start_codon:yes stop_codon:yes gene_type:complete
MAEESTRTESFWTRIITIASGVLAAAVALLILGPRPEGIEGSLDVSGLPLINAIFNSITTVLLVTAYLLIRKKKIINHRRVMLTAFGTSALFLVTYVIYHWFTVGPTPYTGEWRGLYLFILFSHIPLAAAILPLAMVTLYRGWNMRVNRHRKIARITLPVWLYVSLTGVIVYIMLYL